MFLCSLFFLPDRFWALCVDPESWVIRGKYIDENILRLVKNYLYFGQKYEFMDESSTAFRVEYGLSLSVKMLSHSYFDQKYEYGLSLSVKVSVKNHSYFDQKYEFGSIYCIPDRTRIGSEGNGVELIISSII